MKEMRMSYEEGLFLLVNKEEQLKYPLACGDRVELWIEREWCLVQIGFGESGGWYYTKEDGVCGRLALSMRGRVESFVFVEVPR